MAFRGLENYMQIGDIICPRHNPAKQYLCNWYIILKIYEAKDFGKQKIFYDLVCLKNFRILKRQYLENSFITAK